MRSNLIPACPCLPAGNLKWSAAGLTLPGPGNAACESDRTAANDSLPSSVVTANDAGASSVTNSYLYNKRRLLVGETQAQPAASE